MSYIIQYIRESQAKYPNISSSPVIVLEHLLYTNGNGVNFEHGNPVVQVSFKRTIPFIEYYRDEKSFSELVKHLNENREQEIEETYNRLQNINKIFISCGKNDKGKTDNELWQEACHQFNTRYDDVDSIDNYTLDDLKNVSVLEEMIKSMEYPLHLGLSDGYYKMFYIDSNTDKDLLEVSIAFSKACLNILKSYIADPSIIETKKDLFIGDGHSEVLKAAKLDIVTLERDIKRMDTF